MGEEIDYGWLDQEPETAAQAKLAASALGPLSQRIEGIAGYLVDHPTDEKLTNFFNRNEPNVYAKIQYLLALTAAVGQQDKKGFHFPDFDVNLIRKDYQLRTSVKQQTRKILESITKIFERSGEGGGRRGGLLNRR